MHDAASSKDSSNGRRALERFAPAPARALARIERAAWDALHAAGRLDLGELASRVVAEQHGLTPLRRPADLGAGVDPGFEPTRWRQAGQGEDVRAALGFAEQMSFDVASLQDAERQALFASLGADAVPFVQAVYVADLVPRVRAALDCLFGATPDWGAAASGVGESPVADPASELQAAFDEWIRSVPQLQALDPVSTELVRLLGARRHRCRICQSLRSRSALVAGGDEALFEAVDRHAESDLSQAHRALLAFADEIILPPGRPDEASASRLLGAWSPAACVELVLDVARNATNKVAVALAADAPHVESGIEIYDVGPDGELLYGLEAP
jgi:alkylhydroperoxidase family enzyme